MIKSLKNLFLFLCVTHLIGFANAQDIDFSKSIFAVVTKKKGFASLFAHEHLIIAPKGISSLNFVWGDPSSITYEVEFQTEDLIIDDNQQRSTLSPLIQNLDILEENLSSIGKSDSRAIRKSMLSRDQLDVFSYPTIKARLHHITKNLRPNMIGNEQFNYTGKFEITIKNKTVFKDVSFQVAFTDTTLEITAVQKLNFTDFGITPYSAFFGAVKVSNEFVLLVKAQTIPN
ncbi:YceI family protein [Bacteriovoracaceae bacterium]|nr:YceI family protein [Bacteriovoracaceae bacterium]